MSNYEDKLWELKEDGDGKAQPFLSTLKQFQDYGIHIQWKFGVESFTKDLNI
jgi:hypothetical protein